MLAVYSWRVDASAEAAITEAAEAIEDLTDDNLLSNESTDFSLEMAAEEPND